MKMNMTYRAWATYDPKTVIHYRDKATAETHAAALSQEGETWMVGVFSGVGEDAVRNYGQLSAWFKGVKIWQYA